MRVLAAIRPKSSRMPFANVALERSLNVALERSSRTDEDFDFDLPRALEADAPAEGRGAGRDDVKLLVTTRAGISHAHFPRLPEFLAAGDLVVLNRSATVPAALTARRPTATSCSCTSPPVCPRICLS